MYAFKFAEVWVDQKNVDESNSYLTYYTNYNNENIMLESLPEYVVVYQLYIVVNADERLLRTALPLEETVRQCNNQWYKNRKDVPDKRNEQESPDHSHFRFYCF